jgi:hypothetical protein
MDKCKHEFLSFIHFIWDTRIDNKIHLKNIERILIDIKPRSVVTIGNLDKIGNLLTQYFTFEYRKKWIHIGDIEQLSIHSIEYCSFNSFK